jgi:hypothetical protein
MTQWPLVFEPNDGMAQGLKEFASEQKLALASFKAVGALSSVKLGWLNQETKMRFLVPQPALQSQRRDTPGKSRRRALSTLDS